MTRPTSRFFVGVLTAGTLTAFRIPASYADQKAGEVVAPFVGSFAQVLAIRVPAFRGLEPRLSLGYSSGGGNGLAGAGWSLEGFSVIQRASAGGGAPRYDASDIYLLHGQELLACPTSGPSASCQAGGSHSTKNESYLKIRFDSSSSSWTIWGRDGTRTVLTAVYVTTSGAFRWGQTSVVDTNGNTVSYAWNCTGGDCYPDLVTYGPYWVKLYWEARTDGQSFATGVAGSLGYTGQRLSSVLVRQGANPVRAYKLGYGMSALTSRSLLTTVQEYGRDVVIDAAGIISGGSALPERTFVYQQDAQGNSFRCFGAPESACPVPPPPTPTPAPGPTPTPPPIPPCYASFNLCLAACPSPGVCERRIECGGPAPAQAHKCFP